MFRSPSPGAIIGFAGARSDRANDPRKLPEAFQRAPNSQGPRMSTWSVPRQEMRDTLARLCGMLNSRRRLVNPPSRPERSKARHGSARRDSVAIARSRPRRSTFRLGRTRAAAGRDGPARIWPCRPTIHVAGTTAKGSTLGLPARRAGGLRRPRPRVHLAALLRFNERIRLAAPGGASSSTMTR